MKIWTDLTGPTVFVRGGVGGDGHVHRFLPAQALGTFRPAEVQLQVHTAAGIVVVSHHEERQLAEGVYDSFNPNNLYCNIVLNKKIFFI